MDKIFEYWTTACIYQNSHKRTLKKVNFAVSELYLNFKKNIGLRTTSKSVFKKSQLANFVLFNDTSSLSSCRAHTVARVMRASNNNTQSWLQEVQSLLHLIMWIDSFQRNLKDHKYSTKCAVFSFQRYQKTPKDLNEYEI